MRSHLAATLVALAAVVILATSPVYAAPKDEIRSAFSKFVAAQNAHDLKAVRELLSDSPDFLWIAPGHTLRGRDAALSRFRELFLSTWRIDPDWSTFQVLMLDVSTAEIFVRVSTSDGVPARSARMIQVLVNTARGWRVLSIVTGSAPPN
jgi:ketosteroid isomerase-like protein